MRRIRWATCLPSLACATASATEFTQVNPHINAMLVRRAMRLLELRAG